MGLFNFSWAWLLVVALPVCSPSSTVHPHGHVHTHVAVLGSNPACVGVLNNLPAADLWFFDAFLHTGLRGPEAPPWSLAVVCGSGALPHPQAARMFLHEARRATFPTPLPTLLILAGDPATQHALDVNGVITATPSPAAPGLPHLACLAAQCVPFVQALMACVAAPSNVTDVPCGGVEWWLATTASHPGLCGASFVPFEPDPRAPTEWQRAPNRQCRGWRPYQPVVGVLVYRPQSLEGSTFEGGFVAALHLLRTLYAVIVVNIAESQQGLDYDALDVVLVKSNWDWGVDTAVRATIASPPWRGAAKRVLLISGVAPPPPDPLQFLFYDVLVHETRWYRAQIAHHPRLQQAFGVDTTVFRPLPGATKRWDALFVGGFLPYKRPWLLLDKPGTAKLAVGRMNMAPDMLAFKAQSAAIVRQLVDGGVVVRPPLPFAELNAAYNAARLVYIPSTVTGGGERAVLEARAAGAAVEVASDNPKLAELVDGPVLSHVDYAAGLAAAVGLALAGGRAASTFVTLSRASVAATPAAYVLSLEGCVGSGFRPGSDGLWCVAANHQPVGCTAESHLEAGLLAPTPREVVHHGIPVPPVPPTSAANLAPHSCTQVSATVGVAWLRSVAEKTAGELTVGLHVVGGVAATSEPSPHLATSQTVTIPASMS